MADKPEADGVMSWERAWDVDEMRKHARNWSLAGDAGLTGVRVNNAFNDFIMLANSQFVENRVYDEDVTVDESGTLDKKDTQEKSQEQKEAELIPKITEALTLGLNVIDTAFEKLDINEANSSSEEDNIPLGSDELLEPKDLYLSRPLPHLIGSVNFMHDENVGLAEISSDDDEEEGESKEDLSTASESENESTTEKTAKPSPQKDDWSKSETGSETDEDLFAAEEGKISEDENRNDNESKTSSQEPGNLLDELNSKLKSSEARRPSKPDMKQKVKHKKDVTTADDIFCHVQKKTPEEDSDEEDALFRSKPGHFQSAGQLFDDDNENDLFSDIDPKKSPTDNKFVKENSPGEVSATKSTGPKTDLFEDDNDSEDDLFAVAAKSAAKPLPKKQGGLFSEDEKHEDITENKESSKVTKKKVLAGAVSMFGPGVNPITQVLKQQNSSHTDESVTESDSESDRYSGSIQDTDTSSSGPTDITTAVTKLPSGGQLKKKGIQILPTHNVRDSGKCNDEKQETKPPAPTGHGLFDDDEDDLFSAAPSQSNKSVKSANKPTVAASSLFVDEDEEDLFSSMKESTAYKKPATQDKVPSHQVLSLFDDADEADDIFAAKTEQEDQKNDSSQQGKKTSKSLTVFDDEDVLFGVSDDDPSVDLFGTSSPLASSKKAAAAPNKNASRKDNPPFGRTDVKASDNSNGSSKIVRQSKDLDLFGEEDDDTEDLFTIATKCSESDKQNDNSALHRSATEQPTDKKTVSKETAGRESYNSGALTNKGSDGVESLSNEQSVSGGLAPKKPFTDESLLFRPTEDELFSAKTKPPQTSKTKPSKSGTERSLFCDDEEGELFSGPADKSNKTSSNVGSESGVTRTTRKADTNLLQTVDNVDVLKRDQSLSETEYSEKLMPSSHGTRSPVSSTTGATLPGAMPVFGTMRPSPQPEQRNKDNEGGSLINLDDASTVTGFDQPMDAATLPSVTKARARVGMRRRPPTRHKITLGATSVDSSDQDVADFFSNTTSSAINADVMLDKSRIPNHSAPIIGKSGKDMPPDLPSSDISVVTNQSITVTDTFYDGERVSSKADDLNRTSATIPDNDDIFADGYDTVKPKSNYFQSAKPLFMDKHAASKPNQPASGPLITDSEAISRPPEPRLSENSSTSRLQTKSTKQNATSGIVDEVDDIFADSVLNKPKLGRIQKTNKDDLFGGSEYSRIDDIFGADDDEDIFGSSSTSTQKVATSGQGRFSKKMEAVSDDDLFGSHRVKDVNVNKTENTEKSSTKATKNKEELGKTLPSIFDDHDDLFVSKSATGQKVKSSKISKQTSSKAKPPTEDIFADDIFQDPLFATKK
ncbi:hypothetical protein LSH36_235g03030 [Paralvinella palmiformis]|uniref:FAM21/CAPZIP domain-containing protein n=1 Tax=Paralvinella palmiformis TaxID=53620 RepID=A0AAD9JM64_9ANNE|nr:hypothetical protein LSH36_235g03030 [Paralvinella palmiformis]